MMAALFMHLAVVLAFTHVLMRILSVVVEIAAGGTVRMAWTKGTATARLFGSRRSDYHSAFAWRLTFASKVSGIGFILSLAGGLIANV